MNQRTAGEVASHCLPASPERSLHDLAALGSIPHKLRVTNKCERPEKKKENGLASLWRATVYFPLGEAHLPLITKLL